jgi:predicted enzyme related to lactoylglutathione lyase
MATHGTIHWTELMTGDVDAAKEYYAAVCGWTFSEMPMPTGTYYICMNGERPVGGIVAIDPDFIDDPTPRWITYLAVDDVDAAVAQTSAAGGKALGACFDVPQVGRIGMVSDPGGAVLGLITPAEDG